jgi:hypothetical protein
MTKQRENKIMEGLSAEERHARRAFRNAMSKGLKKSYDAVTTKRVPDDFMALLAMADQNQKA